MKQKYLGYCTDSMRADWWDYETSAVYFVTMNTAKRRRYFGKVINGSMCHSPEGLIACQQFEGMETLFDYVYLHEYVVMPDHVHALIQIHGGKFDDRYKRAALRKSDSVGGGGVCGMKNPMLSEGISKVVHWLKASTTRNIRKSNPQFGWQSGYHDKIVLEFKAFTNYKAYIRNNPAKWTKG